MQRPFFICRSTLSRLGKTRQRLAQTQSHPFTSQPSVASTAYRAEPSQSESRLPPYDPHHGGTSSNPSLSGNGREAESFSGEGHPGPVDTPASRKLSPLLMGRRRLPAAADGPGPRIKEADRGERHSHKPGGRISDDAQATSQDSVNLDPGRQTYSQSDEEFWDVLHEAWDKDPLGYISAVPRRKAEAKRTEEPTAPEPTATPTSSAPASLIEDMGDRARTEDELANARLLMMTDQAARKKFRFSQLHKLRLQLAHDPTELVRVEVQFERWKEQIEHLWTSMEANGPVRHAAREDQFFRWLLTFRGVDSMRQAWRGVPTGTRKGVWSNMLLTALQMRPTIVPYILQATLQEPLPPSYAVQDSIRYLIDRMPYFRLAVQREDADFLAEAICFIMRNSPPGYLRLRQKHLFLLSRRLEPDKVLGLYQSLRAYGHRIHHNTLEHFASSLAKHAGTKQAALDFSRALFQGGAIDINTPRGSSLCTSLLHIRKGDSADDSALSPAELFGCLLEHGLSPNLITYSAIIRNLSFAGEVDTAFDVLETMRQHNIEPDEQLYSILLHGAKRAGDVDAMERIIMRVAECEIRNPVLWNDVLHAIFDFAVSESRAKKIRRPRILPTFRPLLQTYAKIFDLAPLQVLIDIPWDQAFGTASYSDTHWRFIAKAERIQDIVPSWSNTDPIEPDSVTLSIMVSSFIKAVAHPYQAVLFYSNFRKLLKKLDPVAVRLVREQGTVVYDIVLKGILEWQGMSRVAMDVIKDMLEDAKEEQLPEGRRQDPDATTFVEASDSLCKSDSTAETGPLYPAPSVYSWNILINGLMYHQHHKLAERLLVVMEHYGIAPNQVTWNTLCAGYANVQYIGKTVNTLRRLDAAGFTPDEFTYRAFSYLRDKGRALEQMEEILEKKRRQDASDYVKARQSLTSIESEFKNIMELADHEVLPEREWSGPDRNEDSAGMESMPSGAGE